MEDEIWKPIIELEGFYSASSHGRIRREIKRTNTKSGRIRKLVKNKFGYLRVHLSIKGKKRNVSVHRLVAFAFLGPSPQGKNQVNHKDGDRINNFVQNFEWCNAKENTAHSINILGKKRKGEFGGNSKISDINRKKIIDRIKNGERGIIVKLAEEFGVTPGAIQQIKRNAGIPMVKYNLISRQIKQSCF